MYFCLIIFYIASFCILYVSTNNPLLVNDLIDPFIKERVNKLGDVIQLGDINFDGIILKKAFVEGLKNLRRSGDIYAWDWYMNKWSAIFGNFELDYLIIRSPEIIDNHIQNLNESHSGWIKIYNAKVHIHYEAYFMENGNCKLDKELIGWSWLDDLIITDSGGSQYISEDEINKLKSLLISEPIKNYFRQLFMYKCLNNFPEHSLSYYFPIKDY